MCNRLDTPVDISMDFVHCQDLVVNSTLTLTFKLILC